MLWEIFKKLRILFVRFCLLLGDDVILNVNCFNLLVVWENLEFMNEFISWR